MEFCALPPWPNQRSAGPLPHLECFASDPRVLRADQVIECVLGLLFHPTTGPPPPCMSSAARESSEIAGSA